MIEFKSIDNFKPGQIQELLKKSYSRLIHISPNDKEKFYSQWEREDRDAFDNPRTIGAHVLFSCINEIPIGFFSWDDRQYPIGLIGQNCILPEYQRHGYGTIQIQKIIDIFEEKEFTEIRVITGEQDFFKEAQNLYIKLGFKELKRLKGDSFKLIEYGKLIDLNRKIF